MAFSVTKSVVSVVAGVAFDDGLLVPDQPVHEIVDVAEFRGPHNDRITWRHLLQQSSQWEGELWGKPPKVDAQSFREGTETHGTPPGEGWAYNDVRMNLLTYALTLLFRTSLADVLRDRVMGPLGASDRWSWHGYRTSTVTIDGRQVEVVSGGAHWGGGLFIPARDLALIGQLFLNRGIHGGVRLLSAEWIRQSWSPCPVKPEYGYLWWLNDDQIPWPGAPPTGRSARGNGGRHLLWVDPARDLVLASHWTEEPLELIRQVSDTVTVVRELVRVSAAAGTALLRGGEAHPRRRRGEHPPLRMADNDRHGECARRGDGRCLRNRRPAQVAGPRAKPRKHRDGDRPGRFGHGRGCSCDRR